MRLEGTLMESLPMQTPFDFKDTAVSLLCGPCDGGNPASCLLQTAGSTTSFRRRRGSFHTYPRQICAALLSVVALVTIIVYYFRKCHSWAGRGNLPRRLAGRSPPLDEDPVVSSIVDLCLEMASESSSTSPFPYIVQSQQGRGPHLEAQPGLQQGLLGLTTVSETSVASPSTQGFRMPTVSETSLFPPYTQGFHIQGSYDPQRDPRVGSEAYNNDERPYTSSMQLRMSPPYVGVEPYTAAEGTWSGVIVTGNMDSFGSSAVPALSAHPCSYSTPCLDPTVTISGLAASAGSSIHQQPLLQSNQPSSNHQQSSPQLGSVRQKRQLAPAETWGSQGYQKRLRGDTASLEAPPMPTLEFRDLQAPEEVFGGFSIAWRDTPEADADDRLTKAIRDVPHEWLPPPLDTSALSPGLRGDAVSLPVASAWQGEVGEPSGSASALEQFLHTSETLQCSYSACIGQTTSVSSASLSESYGPQPGTSAQVVQTQNAFYKLPKVDPNARLDVFSTESAFTYSSSLKEWETFLTYIHTTLSKESLSDSEASGLLRICERLVGHAFHFQRTAVSDLSPANAVPVLGIRYLILESLLNVSQVLGAAMQTSQWWQKLVDKIPSRVDFDPIDYPQRRCRDYAFLALKLSSALQSLKQGRRLRPAEAAALKNELLCAKTCHRAFKRSFYDNWRCENGRTKGDNAD